MSSERRTSNGRRWPTRKPRPDRWSTFRYVVIREAMYTSAAHPLLVRENELFRAQLRDLADEAVVSMFRRFIEAWPARRFRP